MNTSQMNINEASKACGLSPSVLRIWELRYGWPNPKRKANGYRAYNQHQVQELKRVSDLVKRGTPISALIIDGLPRWPTDQAIKRTPMGLTKARAIEKPAGVLEAKLQDELIEALEDAEDAQAFDAAAHSGALSAMAANPQAFAALSADPKAFAERCANDRHHFRFIVSPDDAPEMADLKGFARELAGQMEKDLGIPLIATNDQS